MELALAEASMFIPPVILGVLLFVYRNSILPFTTNPWEKTLHILSSQLILRRNQFIAVVTNTIKSLAQILRNTIELFTIRVTNFTQPIFEEMADYQAAFSKTMNQVVLAPQAIYQTLQTATQAARYQFRITIENISNKTIQTFTEAATFFNPPPKTSRQQIILAAGIAFTILVILLTWWYLQSSSSDRKTPVEEEPPVQQKPVLENKRPVRRRRKVN